MYPVRIRKPCEFENIRHRHSARGHTLRYGHICSTRHGRRRRHNRCRTHRSLACGVSRVDSRQLSESAEFADGRRNGWRRRLHVGRPDGWDLLDEIFVPEVDGQVVGYGHVGRERVDGVDADGHATVNMSDNGELYGFYLHPDAWGSGAADALIGRCHDALQSRFTCASLWVLRDNPRARRFYERNGWACGTGDDVVESFWAGPQMADIPPLAEPLAEIQYRIAFG